MRSSSLLWSVSTAVFLAGCSVQASCGANTIDVDKAKDFVSTAIAKETGSNPTSVDCPAKIAYAKDTSFDCTAHYPNDIHIKITMKQTSDKGDVVVTSSTGVVISKTVEAKIVEGVEKQLATTATVDCGDRMHPSTPGSTFKCKVTDKKGQHVDAVVTVKDETGAVDWNIPPAAPAEAEPPTE